MSEIADTPALRPTGNTASTGARAAIARAARATGMDFDYLLAQAKLESGLNPQARAGSSSATGLYQFLGSTWLDTLQKHGAEHGLGWASAAAADPALRGQALALRTDPDASALMAAELASDNRAGLAGVLGREPDPSELYLAHFLGLQGAGKFLSALSTDPDQSAAALLPGAAASNRAIFYSASGPRSVGDVMGLLRNRLSSAMEGGSPDQWADAAPDAPAMPAFAGGPVARAFQQAAAESAPERPSMAETLRRTFNVGGPSGAAAPENVSYAYRRLSALGF